MDALLLLVPQARAMNHRGLGDFHMDRAGRLRRREPRRVAPFVFTGIQMLSKRAARAMRRRARSRPTSCGTGRSPTGRCFGAVHQGLWFDVGNPEAIARDRAGRWPNV